MAAVLLSEREGLQVENALQDNRFTKANRLRKSVEFDRVFKNGTKVVTPVLVFFWLPVNLQETGCRELAGASFETAGNFSSRLGLVVSKKAGNAVVRNRIKRMIREAFRLSKHLFPFQFDLVVIPRFGAKDGQLEAYIKSFQTLAKRMKRRKKG
ncbi:MAG: ribonuclease P protein component [Acidobacteria bacterium]|nr:MAG: ribonuclease P protein component [Acidobacteriota bacterium]PIE89160.1 MAG: ribonuclease P protein component [Acidobacteriota bacterium]